MIEVTCTAMRRPGIFGDMLDSFVANLRGIDWKRAKLYLNIDPVPAAGSDLITRAAGIFGEVVANQPDAASFPAAVKWCWQQPKGDFFLSLEDDWIIREPVEFDSMLRHLQSDPMLSLVNLRAYKHDDDRLCLAPGLWRTAHARRIAEQMRTDANPEMQLRRKSDNNPHGGLHIGYKGMQFPRKVVLMDIGRPWMVANGLRRDQGRNFVRWKA